MSAQDKQTINQINFDFINKESQQQSAKEMFDKIQAATTEHVVICPVQGVCIYLFSYRFLFTHKF